MRRVSIVEWRRSFAPILREVSATGQRIVVTRSVAMTESFAIVPLADVAWLEEADHRALFTLNSPLLDSATPTFDRARTSAPARLRDV